VVRLTSASRGSAAVKSHRPGRTTSTACWFRIGLTEEASQARAKRKTGDDRVPVYEGARRENPDARP
jgi:hypothetical protein